MLDPPSWSFMGIRTPATRQALLWTAVLTAAAAACSSSHSAPTARSTSTLQAQAAGGPTSTGSSASAACGSGSGNGQAAGRESSPPGDIPDTQAYVAYSGSSTYTVQVPEGWAQTGTGDAVSFTDKLNTIETSVKAVAAAPTVASVEATDVPAVRAESTCPTGIRVSTAARSAGTAILITYQQNSAPDPVTGKVYLDDVQRYLFWRSGSETMITLISPAGADNVDPWRRVTDSFRWVG